MLQIQTVLIMHVPADFVCREKSQIDRENPPIFIGEFSYDKMAHLFPARVCLLPNQDRSNDLKTAVRDREKALNGLFHGRYSSRQTYAMGKP